MELAELERQRVEKLERLRAEGITPYPRRVKRTHTIAQALAALKAAEESGAQGPQVAVTGRLRSMRVMGKIAFAHIEDGSGAIQLFLRIQNVGQETYEMFKRDFDLGDFVGAEGALTRTRTGESSVLVERVDMLSKSVSPLPVIKEKEEDGERVRYSAFSDIEERYRQRYADLASNPEVREIFRVRARTLSALRRFFDEHDFLQVETPILQPIYGGAAARPFVTYHQQLHQDLYLRISFELYLKRLLVGMYDRVYEIGRDFRNEGISPKHNPEFTQLEFYAAYWDYGDVMTFCEQMVATVAKEVTGSPVVHYQGHEIDLRPPWRRVTLRDISLEVTGIDYFQYPTAEALAAAMQAQGLPTKPGATWGYLIDKGLLGAVEPTLTQPTFVMDYPRDISPLAKTKPNDPTHVERFEFFIAGLEMGNAFTELNDPFDQEQRFLEMGRLYAPDNEEAHPMDDDYLRAMKYGMPPNGGFGMGVDRLVMLLTDQSTIREVILFPQLRAKE
ncbi:MAG: lysine--tRNA ligase [Chloroflexi bacterium]|nr:MAG: lysine--tRNA ligase [Anaerolineaceae bacterium 4572_32.2]RLC85139.1 MAG: lysine--tRNA ligase [Chloroflexota bacterium]HEY72221.1 lysine--tRNA ligase [Thermoflexia bacterium]